MALPEKTVIKCEKYTFEGLYVAGICRNQAFPEMPGFSSIALIFAENVIYLTMLRFWEMAQY